MHISSKCSLAIHCLLFLNEFGNENNINSAVLAASTGANPAVIRKLISAMKKAGIVETENARSGTKICCALKDITLLRVCSAIEPDFLSKLMGVHTSPNSQCVVGKNIYPVLNTTYAKIQADMEKSLAGITMQDIVDDYHAILP